VGCVLGFDPALAVGKQSDMPAAVLNSRFGSGESSDVFKVVFGGCGFPNSKVSAKRWEELGQSCEGVSLCSSTLKMHNSSDLFLKCALVFRDEILVETALLQLPSNQTIRADRSG
jgi:hypothetical protein